MFVPSYADSFEVLCLQAAADGRGEALFGSCAERARKELRPFLLGTEFPSVYLEFPLIGTQFLDVTVLYNVLEPGTHVASAAAEGTDAMLDWYATVGAKIPEICCGYELDVKDPTHPVAAVHFQPRRHLDLVRPFCEALGEPERAERYLSQNARMPEGWDLSFFGLFRGRPGSPLRVCGYLSMEEQVACGSSCERLARTFDAIGFTAYDDAMLAQATKMMRWAPGTVDFQFDVYPDGSLSSTFALDVQFGIKQPQAVRASFAQGAGARVMSLLEQWGIADERWHLVPEAAFARSLPVELDDGSWGRFAFTLMPQWAKIRWCEGKLQPSKLYYYANACVL